MASSYSSFKTSSSTKRLFKCFCGCRELTEDEIKHIYRLSAQETLINREACNLFQKFLENERSGDKSEAEEFLNIYEICDEMLKSNGILTEDDIITLSDSGLKYYLEKDLKLQILTGDKLNIKRCLLRIQANCRNEIEISQEYKRFKDAILKKLNN